MSIQRDAHHTLNLKHGITVYVVQDDDAQSPADWDLVGTIVHKAGLTVVFGERESTDRFAEIAADMATGSHIALPVDVRDHGANGVRLDTHSDFADCDAIIHCSPEKAAEEFGTDVDALALTLGGSITDKCKARTLACLESEIETWAQFFRGDVYGVVVHDAQGKVLEAGYGFYGFDYAKTQAKQLGDAEVKAFEQRRREARRAERKEAAERLYWAVRGLVTA